MAYEEEERTRAKRMEGSPYGYKPKGIKKLRNIGSKGAYYRNKALASEGMGSGDTAAPSTSNDFFAGKKNTNYASGGQMALDNARYRPVAAVETVKTDTMAPAPRRVPAMAEPGDPGYDLEEEIVG